MRPEAAGILRVPEARRRTHGALGRDRGDHGRPGGWIPRTTLHILDKHGFVAVIDEDMRHWNVAVRKLVEHCPGFTEKALMRASLNTEHQVLLYPVEPGADAKENVK